MTAGGGRVEPPEWAVRCCSKQLLMLTAGHIANCLLLELCVAQSDPVSWNIVIIFLPGTIVRFSQPKVIFRLIWTYAIHTCYTDIMRLMMMTHTVDCCTDDMPHSRS